MRCFRAGGLGTDIKGFDQPVAVILERVRGGKPGPERLELIVDAGWRTEA